MTLKNDEDLNNKLLLTDIMVRLTALEKILIDKGVILQPELKDIQQDFSNKIAKIILQNANVPGDLDDIISKINKK